MKKPADEKIARPDCIDEVYRKRRTLPLAPSLIDVTAPLAHRHNSNVAIIRQDIASFLRSEPRQSERFFLIGEEDIDISLIQ